MRRSIVFVCLTALVGCGSGNSVTGTVQGNSLAAQDALSFQASESFGGVTEFLVGALIVNISSACSTATNDQATNKTPPNLTGLSLAVANTAAIAPGTYNITSSSVPAASAGFTKTDATCNNTVNASATAGTITISAIDSSHAQGTFNLTFGSDTLTGNFNAPNCNINLNGNPDAGAPTCG